MPRARNIKPGFFENEHLGIINSDARLLFAALWTLADKQGVVEYRIARIRTYAFRYRTDITDSDVCREITILTELDNGKMLSKVTYNDNDYLLIHNFIKHASPHHTEKRGDYPDFAFLKSLINNDNDKITVNSRKHHGENPPESLILIPNSLNPERGVVAHSQKSKLSSDWWIPESWGDWSMKEFGWDEKKVIKVADKFKVHFLASGAEKEDWEAAWRLWCFNEK